MAALWQWVTWNVGTAFDVHEPTPAGVQQSTQIASGWNLQRVVFSGVDTAGTAQAAGGQDYYMQAGAFHVSIGVMRGSSRETAAASRWFPEHVELEQASRLDPLKFWNGVMCTDAMDIDIELRRSAGTQPQDQLSLYCDFDYQPQGLFFDQGGMAVMRHATHATVRYLISRPE